MTLLDSHTQSEWTRGPLCQAGQTDCAQLGGEDSRLGRVLLTWVRFPGQVSIPSQGHHIIEQNSERKTNQHITRTVQCSNFIFNFYSCFIKQNVRALIMYTVVYYRSQTTARHLTNLHAYRNASEEKQITRHNHDGAKKLAELGGS